jgi:hypothetical protein
MSRAEADRLEAEGHALIAQGHELLARAAQARAGRSAPDIPPDDLVPIAEVRLEREGSLPVERLGRRKFTRRSALAALVGDIEAPSPHVGPAPHDPRESARELYVELVARRPTPPRLGSSGASKGR